MKKIIFLVCFLFFSSVTMGANPVPTIDNGGSSNSSIFEKFNIVKTNNSLINKLFSNEGETLSARPACYPFCIYCGVKCGSDDACFASCAGGLRGL